MVPLLPSAPLLRIAAAQACVEALSYALTDSFDSRRLPSYTQEDLDEMIAAQEKFLDAVGFESGSVQ